MSRSRSPVTRCPAHGWTIATKPWPRLSERSRRTTVEFGWEASFIPDLDHPHQFLHTSRHEGTSSGRFQRARVRATEKRLLLTYCQKQTMRAPRRRRSSPKTITPPPVGISLEQVAQRVRYVGSPEHKDTPSFAGSPRPRATATICDRSFLGRQDEITAWLRDAIRHGHTGDWVRGFPKYVWYRVGDRAYIARLVNADNGEYKGWELERHEWPEGI